MLSKFSVELEEAFHAADLRPTAQRYAVLEFLTGGSIHATGEEIFSAVNRDDPRATVYNNLQSLTPSALVREVPSGGKAARLDANLYRHHHFVCEACGSMADIPWFDLPASAGQPELRGREVRNYEIVFRGTCADCGKAARA